MDSGITGTGRPLSKVFSRSIPGNNIVPSPAAEYPGRWFWLCGWLLRLSKYYPFAPTDSMAVNAKIVMVLIMVINLVDTIRSNLFCFAPTNIQFYTLRYVKKLTNANPAQHIFPAGICGMAETPAGRAAGIHPTMKKRILIFALLVFSSFDQLSFFRS